MRRNAIIFSAAICASLTFTGCGGGGNSEEVLGPKAFSSATLTNTYTVNYNGDLSPFIAESGTYEFLNNEYIVTGEAPGRKVVFTLYTNHVVEGQYLQISGNGGAFYEYFEGTNKWEANDGAAVVASGPNNSAIFQLNGRIDANGGNSQGYFGANTQTTVANWPVLPGRGTTSGILYRTPADATASLLGTITNTSLTINAGPSFDFVGTIGNLELRLNFTNGSQNSSYRLSPPNFTNVNASLVDNATEETYVANSGTISYRQAGPGTVEVTIINLGFDGGPLTTPISGVLAASGDINL